VPEWIAIANRRAGGALLSESILDRVRRFAPRVVFTESPGHASELARRAPDRSGVIVVGGDGTLLEVLNGLDLGRHTVAVIPTGRGNSLARDLGLYPLARAFAALAAGHPLPVDLMEVTFHDSEGRRHQSLSASTVAAGYPAAVARSAGNGLSRFGKYSYAVAAALLRPAPTRMIVSGHPALPLTGFVANNTRHMANFVAVPAASCRDGLFDVLQLRAGYFAQAAHNLSAFSRLGFYHPVPPHQSAAISVHLESPQHLMIDGELYPAITAFQIRLLPAALHCLAPIKP